MLEWITLSDLSNDAFRIFIDYVIRQSKKNPEYEANPIIKAIIIATEDIDKMQIWERSMWISWSGESENWHIRQPYAAIIEKTDKWFDVIHLTSLLTEQELPVEVIIYIFRLQIALDKTPWNSISATTFVNLLNEIIPWNNFIILWDHRWKLARDKFSKAVKEGKIHFPEEMKSTGIIEELLAISYNTPREDYPNRIRALMWPFAFNENEIKDKIVVTSPENAEVYKYKAFEYMIDFFLGKTAETREYNKNLDTNKW